MLNTVPLRQALVVAVVLVASLAARGEEVPADRTVFTEFVAEKMRRELGGMPVTVKSPLTLSVGSLQANLDRIFGFCNSNRQRCLAEVDGFVKGAAQVAKERNAPLDRAAVRLVVRSSEYIRRAQGSLGQDGPTLQSQPFVGGLVVLPVLDTPRAVRPLDNRDLISLSLSRDQLLELGRTNLDATLRPLSEVAKPASRGQIGNLGGNVFDTSRVLLHAHWASLVEAQNGTLLVALPATDVLLYVSESTPTAVDALRTLANNVMTKAPNPLSNVILKWTKDGWEAVP